MARFEKKSVYHSMLARESPITIMFTGEVRPSKYRGKPPYIPFRVEGDESDFWYSVENDNIESVLQNAPQNVWITATFAGSRDAAIVSWDGSPAPAPATDGQTAPQPQPQDEPLSRTYFEALETAGQMIDRICADHEKTPSHDMWLSTAHAIAASIFIEYNKNGRTRPIRKEARA